MRKKLYDVYKFIKYFIAPTLKYSQEIYEKVLSENLPGKICLDIGCGRKLLPEWRAEQECKLVGQCSIVGLDCDMISLEKHRTITRRVRGTVMKLPFKNDSFDIVTANMVVEHLDCPNEQLKEICRIIKPGGKFIFHTPNIWNYCTAIAKCLPESIKPWLIKVIEGRHENDIFQTHYRLNSSRAINTVCESTGFMSQKIKMIASDAKFAIIPPLAVFELLFIRVLMLPMLKNFRPNIIAILEKPIKPIADLHQL